MRCIYLLLASIFMLPCTVRSAENLWKYSEDILNPYWTTVNSPTVTESNGITTVIKTIEGKTYFKKNNFANEEDIIEGNTYVAMGQFHQPTGTATEPYIQLNIYWAIDSDTGETTKEGVTARTMELLPWTKLLTVFEAGPTTDLSINSHSAVSEVYFKSLQLVKFPGYSLYSTGDSICEAAYSYTNDPVPVSKVDSGSNYTLVYGYDSRIAFKNEGVPGALLSEIHAKMVTDLASTTYPMIFIEGGVNDIKSITDTPLATMQSQMSAMISLAKSKSDHVVVFNIPPNSGINENQLKQQQYNAWLVTECARQGVQHFDMVAVLGTGGGPYGLDRDPVCYGDQDPEFSNATSETHPNAYGHNKIAVALQAQVTMPSSVKRFEEYIKTEDSVCIGDNGSMPLFSDQDNDGVADEADNCPDVPNPKQHDLNGDGIGLMCDTVNDQDGDGLSDGVDNCPDVPNPKQYDLDGDGIGLMCDTVNDQDNDGIADDVDNCLAEPNPQQRDLDGDHIGLVCDLDTVDNQRVIDRALSSESRAMAFRERIIRLELRAMAFRERTISSEIRAMASRERVIRSEQRALERDDDHDGYNENQGDCNDTNSVIYPGATEICDDGIDQDCDGSDDLTCHYYDDDNDGLNENDGDCNDRNSAIYPGAIEICDDGIDQDCDGSDLICTADALTER